MSSAPIGSPAAERLYYDSPSLEFTARVTDIRLVATERNGVGQKEQLWQLALDRTAFYPESGGQPWDTGVLIATARSGATLEVPVERVEEDEAGEVWHLVRKPLVQDTEVIGRVDVERRVEHTQQHSGQHLLSAIFLRELDARTVSFHLGAESSTIDLALPEGVGGISPEQIEAVESAVNRVIFEDRPMIGRWHAREEAEAMLADGRLRKIPERSGALRVIELSGLEFNACGGTHVPSTGAIGGLLLRRVEKAKDGWRVEFVCGQRAVRTARRDYTVLSRVAAGLSVGTADVQGRVSGLQEGAKAATKERRTLLDELAVAEARQLLATEMQSGTLLAVTFEGKPVEFGKRFASTCARAGRTAAVGLVEAGTGAVVFAVPAGDTCNAGSLLRDVLARCGARGGGSAELAQGVCAPGQVKDVLNAVAASYATAART